VYGGVGIVPFQLDIYSFFPPSLFLWCGCCIGYYVCTGILGPMGGKQSWESILASL